MMQHLLWSTGLGLSLAVGMPAVVVQAQSINELFRQGDAAESAGRYSEAEAIWRRVLRQEPNNAGAYVGLGNALYYQERYEESEAAYRRSLELDPNYARAYGGLGVALNAQERYGESEVALRRSLSLDPNYAIAYNNLGFALYGQGRYEESEAAYRRALSLDPNYAIAYNELGNVLYYQERYEESEAAYRRALELDPNYAIAYNNLGAALNAQERYEESEAALRRSQELDSNYALAYHNLGNALNGQERYEESEAAYRRALELDPNYASAYVGLGNALNGQERYEESEAAYRRSLSLDPNYALAYNNLGFLYQTQGRYEDAIAQYRRALELDPTQTVAQNNLQEAQRLLALRDAPTPPPSTDLAWLPPVTDEPLVPLLRSVVRVVVATPTGVSVGTGWVVRREGDRLWVLTNRHVLTGEQSSRLSDSIEVEFYSEPPPDQFRLRRPAEIEHSTAPDEDLDLALLIVEDAPDDIQPLAIASVAPELDDDVRIIGHHNPDLPWGLARGYVSNRIQGQEMQLSQTVIGKNSSGSPVLNELNQVVGIIVEIELPNADEGRVFTAGFGYAYPSNVILDVLDQWGIR